MTCFIILRMLQQKQLEKKDIIRTETWRKDQKENLDDFELLQQPEEVIQEAISEHYQQDFDSVSSGQHHEEENQIKQEFIEIQENSQECVIHRSKQENMREKEEREKLEEDCRKIQLEILLMNEQLQSYRKEEGAIEELENAVSEHQQIIQDLQQERFSIFQNKIGKDSFSLPLILADEDYQEKLTQQIDKIKQMITLSNLQIGRIKRQTRKYEEMLPMQESNREEFYQKYKKLKKEVDDKREKCEVKQAKENELDVKLAKMKEKCSEIEGKQIDDDQKKEEIQRSLLNKYQQLLKKKEAELKKNSLLTHQIQGNSLTITKNIQELRKQSAELEQKIEALTKRNIVLQQGSNSMMEKYEENRSKLYKERLENNDSNIEQSPPSDFHMPSQQNRRKKYYSQTKNPFTANILNPDLLKDIEPAADAKDRYIFKLKHQKSTPQSSTKETIKEELNQSSTSNTNKQFKLRLPNSTPKKSAKNLNVSLDIAKATPPKTKPKADLSKLSITQRLERIELLERQDRIHSHKLYDIKKKEEENVRKQAVSAFAHSKEFNSADQLQSYQKQLPKDNEVLFDPITNLSSISSKPTRSLSNPPEAIPTQASQQSANIVIPQLTDRLHHNFFKKRIIHRQKKISEEYMKVLQQRGRRILQLDNESQC